ncbi:hypothetical protein BCR34DRAFT_563868 [Clohesyomyces aquaticus]|uniref:DUF2461 domain-containing protein n=1 Tax=Clohesyomyces aquaticus TaxID=1231657 RepID=A0A1Y1ZPW1_9PLEO|nr:hypothetical protein BCR34DRAFT_563868 [Clohesyomyces aquaticus]
MPRNSAKRSSPARRSSSKRPASDKPTPSRSSKRSKAAKTSYVEPETDEERKSADDAESPASDYEEEDGDDKLSASSSDHEVEPSSDEDAKPKRGTPRGRTGKGAGIPVRKKQMDEKELWKPGAKLEPGTQIVIKKPKARDAGETPYTDDTIHPNTMLFLKDLAANNDRQWLKMHDLDYRAALQDFTTFLEKLTEKVIEADETVPELPVKDIIFRIYRDVRFSKDQTPYKPHFSAAWSRTGRKGPYAGYYVQIQPGGKSFVGGGLWQPGAQPLALLRRDIDRKPHKIKHVLGDVGIRKAFLGGVANDDKKVVEAFTNQPENRSSALKKHPKGYENAHKDIKLLRLKSFTLGTKLSDGEVIGSQGLERIAELVGCMVPFVSYSFLCLGLALLADWRCCSAYGNAREESEASNEK